MSNAARHSDLENGNSHRGSNQLGLKQYNERLVISLIQDAGALSKAEIARITKLSAQTVTIIVNRLIDEGYLMKKAVRRGKVGQPSTPIELNPDGAITLGVKIGRRSMDLLVLAFNRQVVNRLTYTYDYPDPDAVFQLIPKAVEALKAGMTDRQRSRIVGIGVAAPTGIEGWEGIIGAPKGALARWKGIDLRGRIEELTDLPTALLNDATAACLAEISLGTNSRFRTLLYFYVGTFVGGGLVLDGRLIEGRTGNAAAVGSVPLCVRNGNSDASPLQLIEAASLNQLEISARKQRIGIEVFTLEDHSLDMEETAVFEEWSDGAANAIAFAAVAGMSFVEAEAIVVDGGISRQLVARLAEKIRDQIETYNLEGLSPSAVTVGEIGQDARAMGGALLPQHANFSPDNNVLLKD